MLDFFPVLGGDGTIIFPPGDIFDQPLCEKCSIQTKLADHVGDHVVLSPRGAVLVTSPGTESSNPPPPIVELFSGAFHPQYRHKNPAL